MKVDVHPLYGARDVAAVRELYPRYIDELAQWTDFYRLDESGVWQPDLLPEWLTLPLLHPLLIETEGTPAGFAFVSEAPFEHMPADCDHCLSEFFVAPPFRRRGIGSLAAVAVFDAFPGSWALEVVSGNAAAPSFWRKVLGTYVPDRFDEARLEGEIRFRFTT